MIPASAETLQPSPAIFLSPEKPARLVGHETQKGGTMAQYDPIIVTKFADRLYSRAAAIIALYGFAGAVFGAGAGVALFSTMRWSVAVGGFFGMLVGLFFGAAIGEDRASLLKLQAQQALCQLQIEWNTRPQHQPGAQQQNPQAHQQAYAQQPYVHR